MKNCWDSYYVSLISSSEKQSREQPSSHHYGDCCCSTMFSFRCKKCNASCKCNMKKWSFNHHLKTCFTGGRVGERVERKACYCPASASPFPCSLITCYLNHAISSAGLAAVLPIRGYPRMRPEGPRRAAPRCWEPARCRQGWCGARIELGNDAFSSGTGTHCSATTAKLSIHHLATSFQMEKSVGPIALFLLKKEWHRAVCLKPTSRFLQSQKFWLDANFG